MHLCPCRPPCLSAVLWAHPRPVSDGQFVFVRKQNSVGYSMPVWCSTTVLGALPALPRPDRMDDDRLANGRDGAEVENAPRPLGKGGGSVKRAREASDRSSLLDVPATPTASPAIEKPGCARNDDILTAVVWCYAL